MLMPVRTTITLDEDVAAKLRTEARRSGRPFRAVVNDHLRKSLSSPPNKVPPFRVKGARDLGARPGLDYDNVWKLIEELEGPFHK